MGFHVGPNTAYVSTAGYVASGEAASSVQYCKTRGNLPEEIRRFSRPTSATTRTKSKERADATIL
ncbi:unnamed protein product [Dovyalis caffra]|uniref:Uncharacterized protein n=1 Tax=Dovyalis caffra TaxID=77055 RepID=A0AAV1QS17_9ROSI|nr:unnamed protein product [Dovyalis caffra]